MKLSLKWMNAVRVRFAPSPTGQLHLGGLRTALINYLFAKSHQGSFVLRIEDTDRDRFVLGAAEKLNSSLEWAGIIPDESSKAGGKFGPYYQSQRLNFYNEHIEQLLLSEHAYRCFCSADRLMLQRHEALRNRERPKYDNKCRHLTCAEIQSKMQSKTPFTVRLKLREKPDFYNDLVFGRIETKLYELEGDPILMKSDGYPTYHFANVVDDHHMQISHVLRGEEWMLSTVKHMQIYDALGWQPPQIGHIPLLTNMQGAKLSKRHGDVFVEQYKAQGYFPSALLNFLTRTGGGFKNRDIDEVQIYSMAELSERFDLSRLGRHQIRVDFDWLNRLNRHALDTAEPLLLLQMTRQLVVEKFGQNVNDLPAEIDVLNEDYMKKALVYSLPRIGCLADMVNNTQLSFFWSIPQSTQHLSHIFPPDKSMELLESILSIMRKSDFSKKNLIRELKELSKNSDIKFQKLMSFCRNVITGETTGPPVMEMFELLGKQMSISRIEKVVEKLKTETVEKAKSVNVA